MKYLLLVHTPDFVATPDPDVPEVQALMSEYVRLRASLEAEGIWLGGQALQPPSASTQVKVRDGETLVVDGPLVETAEQVAGYYLLECRDLDEAIECAARIPGARDGTIEVRPVWEYEQLVE